MRLVFCRCVRHVQLSTGTAGLRAEGATTTWTATETPSEAAAACLQPQVHEALTAALAERVEMEVPASVLRELGSSEYQAKLLEAQAKVTACG